MATIYYEGHANCRVKDGINIWIDPFFEGNSLSKNDWRTFEKPDLILITHAHGDHIGQAVEIVKETNCQIGAIVEVAAYLHAQGIPHENILNYGIGWNIGGTVEFENTKITMHQAKHTSEHGVPVSYVVKCQSGFTFYHAGDTALFYDMKLIGELHSIDLAFLPIGDVFTMDSYMAAKAADFLQARAAMPIHYATFPMLEKDPNKFRQHLKELSPDTLYFELAPNASKEFSF